MAKRPVFIPEILDGAIREELITFDWSPGFSVQQKQKSVRSLHSAAARQFGWDPNYILEVSTKSHQRLGVELSAFSLTLPRPEWYAELVPDCPRYLSLESIYQGSKVFSEGRGPYLELYQYTPRDAKRYMNEHGLRHEAPVSFCFGSEEWNAEPGKTTFYDYLYLKALQHADGHEAVELSRISEACGFTDIEFNPEKSLNCQARSCALYVVLTRQHQLEAALADFASFVEVTNLVLQNNPSTRQMHLAL